MNVKDYPLDAIFKTGIYKIPRYQRKYDWGPTDWANILYDVFENEQGYFLGSFISIGEQTVGNTVNQLVDGQQRFTTLMILLTTIYYKLKPFEDNFSDGEKEIFDTIKSNIVTNVAGRKKAKYVGRLELQTQNNNNDDYKYLLSSCDLISEKVNKPENYGRRKIAKAYKYFDRELDKIMEEEYEIHKDDSEYSKNDALFDLVEKLSGAIMVSISGLNYQDAYTLFESLNNRGIALTSVDLIKNKIMSKYQDDELDDVYERWINVLKNLGEDDYTAQERFLRQYYNSFRHELNESYGERDSESLSLGNKATRSKVLSIYEVMINKDAESLLEDLSLKSEIYSRFLLIDNDDNTFAKEFQDLYNIQGSPSYILLLNIMTYKDQLELDDDMIKSIIETLIKFFVRRNLTDVPGTRTLIDLFINLIDDIKEKRGKEVVACIHDKLKSVSADNQAFSSKLKGDIYDDNKEVARFLLCDIEADHETKETFKGVWERDKKGKYIWTIEHIFPEGKNIPDEWVKMIANGNKEKAKKIQDECVHTLGNLTLTGYNSELSNMSFEKKKDRKDGDGHDIGYNNGMFLNEDVYNSAKWTKKQITDRTDKLVKLVEEKYKW